MAKSEDRIQLIHPEGKNAPSISVEIYQIIETAIKQVLAGDKLMPFATLTQGVRNHITRNKIDFPGSVDWYTISVKNHLESTGIVHTVVEKGRKMHRLKEITS
jgi:hypothetical protein